MKKFIMRGVFLPIVSLFAFSILGVVFAQSSTLTDGDPSNDSCISLQTSLLRYQSKDYATNGEVTVLQDFLISKNLLSGSPTGFYGRLTVAAVKSYQRSVGVSPTGNVGPLTRSIIQKETCSATDAVSINPNNTYNPKTNPIACTMEYRACPDGSAMPRDPNCSWRSDKCSYVSQPVSSTGLYVPGCTIAAGASTCTAKPSSVNNPVSGKMYDLYNATTYLTGSNTYYAGNGYIYNPSYAGTVADLKYGENKLQLRENWSTVAVATAVATASCISGTVWNGSVCVTSAMGTGVTAVSAEIIGGQSTYTAGQLIKFSVKGIDSTGSVATPEKGLHVQAHIRNVDGNNNAVVVNGIPQAVNAEYNYATKSWDVIMTSPSDSSKNYKIDATFYCSSANLGCSRSPNSDGQITKSFTFSVTNISTTIYSNPIVELVPPPGRSNSLTLTLQYDSVRGESVLVGEVGVKITAGSNAFSYFLNSGAPFMLSVRGALHSGTSYRTNSSRLEAGEMGGSISNETGVRTLAAGQSAYYTVRLITPTRELFSDTYSLVIGSGLIDGNYSVSIPSSSFKGSASSNVVTVTGEASNPNPIAEFLGSPTLALQYDYAGKESMLVGRATIKITAGGNGVSYYVVNGVPSSGGVRLIGVNHPYVNARAAKVTNDSSPYENGLHTLSSGQSATYTVTLSVPAKDLYADSYTLVSGEVYDANTIVIPIVAKVYSNPVTVVGESAVSPALAPSGSISVDSSTCTIPVGNNQCSSKISWTTTNPVAGKTVFKNSWIGDLSYADSAVPASFSNNKGENINTYTLSNNGVVLDTKTVTSKCVSGTSWNGSVCAAGSGGSISLFFPSCTIAAGASTCTAKPSYVTNPVSGKTYDLYNATMYQTGGNTYGAFNGYVFNGYYGSVADIKYGTNTLELRESGSSITVARTVATASCVAGTSWNGSVCATASAAPTAIITMTSSAVSSPSHGILLTVGDANTKTWSSTNGVSWKASYSYSGASCAVNGQSGDWTNFIDPAITAGVSGSKANGSNANGVAKAIDVGCVIRITYTVTNASGVSASDTVEATIVAAPAKSAVSLYVPNCSIKSGASTCTAKPSYVTNPVSGKMYDLYNATTYLTGSNTYYAGNGYIYNPVYAGTVADLQYGPNSLELREAGTSGIVATARASASCTTGVLWNGVKCGSGPVAMGEGREPQVLGASTICTNLPSNLHRGAESSSVTRLQDFLYAKGYLSEKPTGFFGDATVDAVKLYQNELGVNESGLVYDLTRAAIRNETCN